MGACIQASCQPACGRPRIGTPYAIVSVIAQILVLAHMQSADHQLQVRVHEEA